MNKTEIEPHEFREQTDKTFEHLANLLHAQTVELTQRFRDKCQQYDFDQIIYVKSIPFGILKYYEVKISLKPGPSHFRGIVKFLHNQFVLVGKISRENKYGDQPNCMTSFKESLLKPFCFCK